MIYPLLCFKYCKPSLQSIAKVCKCKMLFTHSTIRKRNVSGPRADAACASVLGETRRLQGERGRFTYPPSSCYSNILSIVTVPTQTRLIMVVTHAHARIGRTRRIHSIYSERDERLLRRLYRYLQFWLCCSRAWAVERSRLEFYEPEIQLRKSIILFAARRRRRRMKRPPRQSSDSH